MTPQETGSSATGQGVHRVGYHTGRWQGLRWKVGEDVLRFAVPLPAQQTEAALSHRRWVFRYEAQLHPRSPTLSTHLLSAWWFHTDVSPHRSTWSRPLTDRNLSYYPEWRLGSLRCIKQHFNMKKNGGSGINGGSDPTSEEVQRAVQSSNNPD